MKFTGTIIITDPCYIVTEDKDYERTDYGSQLDKLGFTTFLVARTGFGDWSNSITKDNGECLGEFCADSGQVCVVLKNEVLNYEPLFNVESILPSHCYTEIEDFDGEIEIDTSNPNWTMIHGRGNINFDSDSLIEEDEDEYEENDY